MLLTARSLRRFLVLLPLAGLLACGGGSSPSPTPAPTPAPSLPTAWTAYVKDQGHPIESLDLAYTDNSDLAFLGPLLQGRRLVGLGESGHGVAEFSQAKIRLIKYLHEEQGYDVLAFESSILGCFRGDELALSMDAKALMHSTIFGVWSTEDVVKLFDYVRATKATSHPLILAGFDIQLSSNAERLARPGLLQEVVAKIDPSYAAQVHDLDQAFLQPMEPVDLKIYLVNNARSLKVFYQALASFLDAHMNELETAYPDRPLFPLIVRQAVQGMPSYIDELYNIYVTPNDFMTYSPRDAGMAVNLEFLMDTAFPSKKIMAWAHNFHLMHDESSALGLSPSIANMGHLIHDRYGSSAYILGLFMNQGQASWNTGVVYSIDQAPLVSLEGLLTTVGAANLFIDLSQATPSDGSAWAFKFMDARDWGTLNFRLVPKDQYDGVLLVNTVHPPKYVTSFAVSPQQPNLRILH
jgi:erythromycin esterase